MTGELVVGREPDPDEPFLRISATEARRLIEERGAQVVDVRPAREFVQSPIAGALNIDADNLFYHQAELALDRDIVVVCRIGAVSALGAEILAMLDGERVYNLEGGMEEWVRRRYPVEIPGDAAAPIDQADHGKVS